MDAYQELNISKNATQDEIKKAYRDAAKKYHPDKNDKDSSEKMQKINKAYQLIKTPERRERYDEFGDSAIVDNEAAFITSIACSIINDLTKSNIPNIDKHLQQMQQRITAEYQSRLNTTKIQKRSKT
jgi:DnaJ-class molecular chaperone